MKKAASNIATGESPRQITPTVKAVSFSKVFFRRRYMVMFPQLTQLPFATEACAR